MLGPNDTRRGVMFHLLQNREDGLTLDEVATIVGVSRNAIRQHITGLERDGLVRPIGVRRTGRRPSRAYGLTELGGEHFPRQYDRLALSLLEAHRFVCREFKNKYPVIHCGRTDAAAGSSRFYQVLIETTGDRIRSVEPSTGLIRQ